MEAIKAAELPDDPFFRNATEEQKDAYREAIMNKLLLFSKTAQSDIQETLTPEQMLIVRKLEMQMMTEFGVPFPAMFDPLDLTDEQKKEMQNIANEMSAEYDRLTLEQAKLKSERLVAMWVATSELLKGKSFTSVEELNKSLQDAQRQYVPSEALQKKGSDLHNRGTKFVTLLQDRLMNVLTDEQLDKMGQILDETPAFIKKFLAQAKARREAAKKSPTWVPGPDSWQPGMPMPVEFKEQRRGNFPRPKSE
jgi:hypothetical protein